MKFTSNAVVLAAAFSASANAAAYPLWANGPTLDMTYSATTKLVAVTLSELGLGNTLSFNLFDIDSIKAVTDGKDVLTFAPLTDPGYVAVVGGVSSPTLISDFVKGLGATSKTAIITFNRKLDTGIDGA
jgi:hypothetical protein